MIWAWFVLILAKIYWIWKFWGRLQILVELCKLAFWWSKKQLKTCIYNNMKKGNYQQLHFEGSMIEYFRMQVVWYISWLSHTHWEKFTVIVGLKGLWWDSFSWALFLTQKSIPGHDHKHVINCWKWVLNFEKFHQKTQITWYPNWSQ